METQPDPEAPIAGDRFALLTLFEDEDLGFDDDPEEDELEFPGEVLDSGSDLEELRARAQEGYEPDVERMVIARVDGWRESPMIGFEPVGVQVLFEFDGSAWTRVAS